MPPSFSNFSNVYNLLNFLSYAEEWTSLFGIAMATESKFMQWQPHPVTGHSVCSLEKTKNKTALPHEAIEGFGEGSK